MARRNSGPDWDSLILKVPRKPVLVKVPALKYLMVDGQGNPAKSAAFRDSIGALYGLAYTMKFMLKARGVTDAVPMPLEGLFWADDMSAFIRARRGEWKWTLMLLQPTAVDAKLLKAARAELVRKKKNAKLPPVRLRRFAEGTCAQVLHLGPYAAERPTIEGLHRFIEESGYVKTGKHHEIYISIPGRGDPAKMKTVIRQPMRKAPKPAARSRPAGR
ncbi:MAG: hypothetical protein A2177_15495 [Spirochaetes bacterium RBG_13_68_11]|nr:MAG: hypothetical protein A2177_15495 [Spirochaetes bacterium RBG_13_68_11]